MQRPRSFRARHLCASAGLALLLPSAAQAAAFLPGTTAEADPPTGDASSTRGAEPAAARAPAGSGIRWQFGPWRSQGMLTLDVRRLRLEGGGSTSASVFGDMEFASYIWQPWFIQVRAGLGLLAARDSGAVQGGSNSGSASGRFSVLAFPSSRFPFELRGEVADSRTRGDTIGQDFRSTRLSLSQGWRPAVGNDAVSLNLDYSRLSGTTTQGTDTLWVASATGTRQREDHNYELSGSFSRNETGLRGDHSQLSTLSARHGFHPGQNLLVDTLASWNDVRIVAAGSRFETSARQISSVATWRPREGEPLYVADAPLVIAGTARWIETESGDGDVKGRAQAFNATVGATQEFGRDWRLGATAGYGRVDAGGTATTSASANLNVNWSRAPVALGDWRWSPSASASLGLQQNSGEGGRHLEGLQASQVVSRDWRLGERQSINFNVSQSAGVLHESALGSVTRSLAHSAGAFWQASSNGWGQSYVGVSASDARNWAEDGHGAFQLVNAQWTQRAQFTRYSSGAANLTWQATRNDSTEIDVFTGQRRVEASGWQRYHVLTLSYENQRAFGVPRLRFSLLASTNTQQFERRAFGDLDAPRERVSQSLEARLEHSIGRLDSRLSARVARVDDRTVASLLARVQRRF